MGGNIHSSWKVEFGDRTYFVKKNIRAQKLLNFEKKCLIKLKVFTNNDLIYVPEVIKYFMFENSEFLIMEWIDMKNKDQGKLGNGLAGMHLLSGKSSPKKYGYPDQGFIGTNKQLKGFEVDWADCFINLRIVPQMLMLGKQFSNAELIQAIKNKIRIILSGHNPDISLVHGDLWSGNVGVDNNNKGIIFDPACWWADAEVDIAMTKLFGAFREEFYTEYNKLISPKEGSEKRMVVYNFYHILNHANMFQGYYLNDVENYIQSILSYKK